MPDIEFKAYPVVETVFSVQFEPIAALHAAHLGLLWAEYRDRFPRTEERPPIDQVFERFPATPTGRAGMKLQTLDNLPIPRLWYITATGEEMIQVQTDRFIKNWRKENEEEVYPRYHTLRPNFDGDFEIFKTFVRSHDLGEPIINQCEITYVNHIPADGSWQELSNLDGLFTFWNPPKPGDFGVPEDLVMHTRFVIPGQDGSPTGRLHVDIQPAIRTSDQRPMYVMNLTARGQVGNGVAFLDVGHRWINWAFKNLTDPSFHGSSGGY